MLVEDGVVGPKALGLSTKVANLTALTGSDAQSLLLGGLNLIAQAQLNLVAQCCGDVQTIGLGGVEALQGLLPLTASSQDLAQ